MKYFSKRFHVMVHWRKQNIMLYVFRVSHPLSIKEILNELEISKDNYHRALSMSEDLELYLKRQPNF